MTYQYLDTHPDASALLDECGYGKYLLGAEVYNKLIYYGYGNWAKNSCEEPVVIRAFDPVTGLFALEPEFYAQTESVYHFRILSDGGLYIPHIDPHADDDGDYNGKNLSWKLDGIWYDVETTAWHVFDVQEMNGLLYLVGSVDNPGVGIVLVSDDGGISFQVALIQDAPNPDITCRFHFAFVWNNELYVQSEERTQCQIFDGSDWRTGPNLLPNGGMGFFSNPFAGKIVYVSKDKGNPGKLYAFNGSTTVSVKSNVLKYCIYANTLFASFSDGSIKKTADLIDWQNLPTFTNGLATCLVGYGDKLYVGTSQSKVYSLDL